MADSMDTVNVLVIEILVQLLHILKYRDVLAVTKNDFVALYSGALLTYKQRPGTHMPRETVLNFIEISSGILAS